MEQEQFNRAKSVLQSYQLMAVAMQRQEIDMRVVDLARSLHQEQFSSHLNPFCYVPMISFQSRDDKALKSMEPLPLPTRSTTITRYHSVSNDQFQLIPDFYAQTKSRQGNGVRALTADELAKDITYAALRQENLDRNLINMTQVLKIQQKLNGEVWSNPGSLGQQLTRLDNVLSAVEYDPRVFSQMAVEFVLRVVVSFPDLSEEVQAQVNQVCFKALCWTNMFETQEQLVKYIQFIVKEALRREAMTKLMRFLFQKADFFAVYGLRILQAVIKPYQDNNETLFLDRFAFDAVSAVLPQNMHYLTESIAAKK